MSRRSIPLLAAMLSLAACAGGESTPGHSSVAALASGSSSGGSSSDDNAITPSVPSPAAAAPAQAGPSGPVFRGDGSKMLAWGGWAWGNVPADAVAHAGFDWFETGLPGDVQTNSTLTAANIRPFAYINLGELDPTLSTGYTGSILRTNSDWGTQLVDVTDRSWQDWLVRRADQAYQGGSRGIKWDVAQPDIPPGKTRADVNDAMAAVMQRVLAQHPDLKFVFNQGFEFALAYPQYINGLETEGLFTATGSASGYLHPWNDPYYWGPQYQQVKAIQGLGIPIIDAEYTDPSSQGASDLYAAITAEGFVPYITNVTWNIRGWGYGVNPGW